MRTNGIPPIFLVLLLVSCSDTPDPAQNRTPALKLDMAEEPMPFAKPVLERADALPGVPLLPEGRREVLDLRRAFFAGDFARLDTAMSAARERYLSGQNRRSQAADVIKSLEDTDLAGIDACADWLRTMPESYNAHWLCGEMWNAGAWAVRGTKYANEISRGQFALMHERLRRSNTLLERALTLDPKPLEALVQLADNAHLDGSRDRGEEFLKRADKILPGHLGIYTVRMNFSLPEWGGKREQNQAWLERAKQAGVDEDNLLYLEDQYVVRPAKMSTPGATQSYWEQAIRDRPLRTRQIGLLKDFVDRSVWHDALPVANRLIKEYPDEVTGYYQRAVINENLGHIPQARDDYRMAAAMGHDYALQTLILAHVRGGLGIPGKSFEGIAELCRFGATLGSPVGTNCLGASYYEGGPGMPFPRDLAQAFAWHLVGARAGHFNSQYDLGWLLFTGRAPGVDPETGKRIGTFWLRRSAEQGQQFAKRKLEEHRISLSEEVASSSGNRGVWDYVLAVLYWLFR